MHFIEIIIYHVFHGYYISCIPWSSPVFTCIRQNIKWDRGGAVVECLTRDREAAGLSLTDVTALWSLSKAHLSYLRTDSTQEESSLFN